MRGARALVAVALLACFFAASCAPKGVIPSTGVMPPLTPAPAHSIKASAVITLSYPKGGYIPNGGYTPKGGHTPSGNNNSAEISGRASVTAKAPDLLRVEVYGPLGGVAALVIYNGGSLYVYSDGRASIYEGPDTAFVLPLPPEIMVSALTGDTASLRDYAQTQVKTGGASGSAAGSVKDGLTFTKYADGAPAALAHLGDFKDVDGATVPFSITANDIKTGRTITIRYSSVEINPPLQSGHFLPPPLEP